MSTILGALATVETLVQHLPGLQRSLANSLPLSDLPGWRPTALRLHALRVQNERIALVATLYGNTGAGKSTLFRLLTGIQTPVGPKRPTSCARVVAVPSEICELQHVQLIFPDDELRRLTDGQQLIEPSELLHYAPYRPLGEQRPVPLILADVPDFDSVREGNAVLAERMLERAEVVVFVASGDSYKDHRTVQELARTCRIAGTMIYLLTKAKLEDARVKWADLLDWTERHLLQRRQDGRTLHEFLAGCPAYCIPWRECPTLEDIAPLREGQPAFVSQLAGVEAEAALLSSLLEPASELAQECGDLLARAQERRQQLELNLNRIESDLREIAQSAAHQFPLGRLMALIHEETTPIRFLHADWLVGPLQVFSWARGGLSGAINQSADVDSRTPAEQRDIEQNLSTPIERWRNEDFREEVSPCGLLSESRINEARQALAQSSLPDPSTDWEADIRRSISEWLAANYWTARLLANSPPFLGIAGGAAVVLDLVVTGGLLGTLGVPAIGGFAAVLWDWLRQSHLEGIARTVQERWTEQRTRELLEHLQQKFARPLFAPWYDEVLRLDEAPVAACRGACQELENLSRRLWRQPDGTPTVSAESGGTRPATAGRG